MTNGRKTTDRRRSAFHNLVIPAKAGIQSVRRLAPHWIPAFAGMTKSEERPLPTPKAAIRPRHGQTTAPSSFLLAIRSAPSVAALVRGTKLSGPTFSHTRIGADL